ncbi:hypothetical protein MTR67_038354 [Solanum verrucosum]|uniref:THH1/TOM1/TOM3 domain-containing protein n=1 Tax=Solanum verrucosum TaxID=315347 RepID=A0AAF0UGP4_SOLVR|nr:hypothetical protein MTR67_038354 [Solanum verrucosum]
MMKLLLDSSPIDIINWVTNWWYDINKSIQWQHGIFFTLCALYSFVSIIALIQVIRIHLRIPLYGWSTQKVFHMMIFVANSVGAIVFGLHNNFFMLHSNVLMTRTILDLQGLFFFTTFTHLVWFWADVYYKIRSFPTSKLKIWYISINCVIYLILGCIWICIAMNDNDAVVLVKLLFIRKIFVAVIPFIANLGVLIYGGRLFIMVWRYFDEWRGGRKKLSELGYVSCICFTCFSISCFVAVLSCFHHNDRGLDHPVLKMIYYMVVEILPSALFIYILQKLPRRRVSGQYHPII